VPPFSEASTLPATYSARTWESTFTHSASTEQAVAKIFDLHSQLGLDISIEMVLKSLQRIGNAKTAERTSGILEIAEKLWARFHNVLQGLSEDAANMRWIRLLSRILLSRRLGEG
jgi:hypothetical protein